MGRLYFDPEDDRYVFRSRYEERFVAKRAGFRWSPNERVWYTPDKAVAARLIDHAVPECVEGLKALSESQRRATAGSRAAVGTAGITLPAPAGLEYRPFQVAGVEYALDRDGVLFGDEMGLGKTIQACGTLNGLREGTGWKDAVVVCPTSLVVNWQREIERWVLGTPAVEVIGAQWPDGLASGIRIVPYSRVNEHAEKLAERHWDVAILDECHYLKKPKALRTQAVLGQYDRTTRSVVGGIRATKRCALSGTPIPNRPMEIYPVLEWLGPSEWGGAVGFGVRYANGNRTRYGWDFDGASNLGELQMLLRERHMVRRLKRDVLGELPAKTRQIVELPADDRVSKLVGEEWQHYENQSEELTDARVEVELAKTADNEEAYREAVAGLEQATRVHFENMSNVRRELARAKVEVVANRLLDTLEDAPDAKVVVFAHHRDTLGGLNERLTARGIGTVLLSGATPPGERQALVDKFQSDPQCRVFVGSIQAAGVGITLTAAQHCVFAELDWVPGNIVQAEDRLHRIGQQGNVLVQHMVFGGSLDAKFASTLVAKLDVLDQALDADWNVPIIVEKRREAVDRSPARVRIAHIAERLDESDRRIAGLAMERLAGACDGARALDGSGFSRLHAGIGRRLAERSGALTAREAALAFDIAQTYKNTQLRDFRASKPQDGERVAEPIGKKRPSDTRASGVPP